MPRLMVNEDYSGNGMDRGKKSRKQEDWDRDVHLNKEVNHQNLQVKQNRLY